MDEGMFGMIIIVCSIVFWGIWMAWLIDGPHADAYANANHQKEDPEDVGERQHAMLILVGSACSLLFSVYGVLVPEETSLPRAGWGLIVFVSLMALIGAVARLAEKPKYAVENTTADNVINIKR